MLARIGFAYNQVPADGRPNARAVFGLSRSTRRRMLADRAREVALPKLTNANIATA